MDLLIDYIGVLGLVLLSWPFIGWFVVFGFSRSLMREWEAACFKSLSKVHLAKIRSHPRGWKGFWLVNRIVFVFVWPIVLLCDFLESFFGEKIIGD